MKSKKPGACGAGLLVDTPPSRYIVATAILHKPQCSLEASMRVTNRTHFKVIAFGYHVEHGYGEDVEILPHQTKQVNGPYLGEMDGGDCYVVIRGKLICHTEPDDGERFQIKAGKPIRLLMKKHGINVRHHEDPVDAQILSWRTDLQA